MSWFGFSDSIKKRLCRYVLQRYLGQFLLEKISLDQLSLDLSSSSGAAEITDVYLDVKCLNEISEAQHWPVLFVDGYIGSVRVEVPWKNILSDNSRVRVSRLMLTVQPRSWAEELSLFESMYSSMISSKQMAEEIFRTEPPEQPSEPDFLSGLEQFAVAIDTIFNRVIVSFEDTTLRVEQLMHEGPLHFWAALEINIARLEYHDALASSDKEVLLEEQALRSTKKVIVSDVKFFVDRFNNAKCNEQNPRKVCGALCTTSPEIESCPLPVAFLKGDQELEVGVDHGDKGDLSGNPKIGVQICLSELPIYVDSSQMMLLSALLSSFVGATGSDAGIQHESPCKALSSMDFAVMERDLQGMVLNGGHNRLMSDVPSLGSLGTFGSGVTQRHTWAGGDNGDNDDDTDDYGLRQQQHQQYLPMSSADSQTTSVSLGSLGTVGGASAGGHNMMAIQTEFTLKIGVIFMVILEEKNNTPEQSARFFKEIDGVPLRDIITVTTPDFLPERHFRVALYPVTLNGRTKSSISQRALELALTVANAEVARSRTNWIETLLESHLKVDGPANELGGSTVPFVRLKVKHVYNNPVNSGRAEITNVSCAFGMIRAKYDRLLEARLLEMFGGSSASASGSKKFEDYSARPHEVHLNFTCPRLSCEIRFQALEVANIRKELRPDALILTLEKITVAGKITNDPLGNQLKILFQSGTADYRPTADTSNGNLIQLAKVFSDLDADEDGCGSASIIIQYNAADRNLLQEASMVDSMMQHSTVPMRPASRDMTRSEFGPTAAAGTAGAAGARDDDDGPFVYSGMAYNKEASNRTEQMVRAGNRKHLQTFYDKSSNDAKVVVDVVLPTVVVEFANRELLEVIYNRVLVDLAYTSNFDCQQHFGGVPGFGGTGRGFFERSVYETMTMTAAAAGCGAAGMAAASSAYAGGVGTEPLFFYSVTDDSDEQQREQRYSPLERNQLCLSLTVRDACLLLGHGNADKKEYFTFQLRPQQVQLYVISGYRGDPNVSYVMVHAGDVEVRHESCNSRPMETHAELNKDMMLPRKGTRLLLNRISRETFGKYRANNVSQEMLCVALKVRADPVARMKTVMLAVSVAEAAWRHQMTPPRQLWITQLIELATLRDLPIAGHVPSSVVTELHFNLEKSLIDYRPLHIPYNAVVSSENFYLSSTIVPKSTSSTMRLILEDTSLFIARGDDQVKPLNLINDYVCVINSSLLDICLVMTASRTTSQAADSFSSSSSFPMASSARLASCPIPNDNSLSASGSTSAAAIKFTASNDVIYVRTCADSLFALQSFAMYLANDGDLAGGRERPPVSAQNMPSPAPPSSPQHIAGTVGGGISNSSSSHVADHNDAGHRIPSQHGTAHHRRHARRQPTHNGSPQGRQDISQACSPSNMNEMMEDAMSECLSDEGSRSESGRLSGSSSSRSLSSFDHGREQSPPELAGRVFYNPKDEDFLLLEDLPGSGLLRQNGQPNIRVINGDKITLIDDFLKAPTGKTDQLKAPTGSPDPVEVYTLNEMTIIWFLYGGSDFGESRAPGARVGSLTALGGQGRVLNQTMELSLSKIRFQHEIYPPGQSKASYQCLLIKDILIKDKLSNSEINKFLYQFSTDSLPRQAHANMLTLRVTHIAPDNECSINVSLKPLRLNIDQDALMFLRNFFVEVSKLASSSVTSQSPLRVPPVSETSPAAPAVYIRSFTFNPAVPVRIDYRGKHVTLETGAFAGLLMGLGQLTCLELNLKRLENKHGVLGIDRLVEYAQQEWLNDIKTRQVQNVIGGVGPMHSIVKLCSGLRDFFWLPVEQYRKDGQIVRGLQRGTHSFTTNTAIAFLELTGRAVGTIQHAAELAYNLLSPSASVPILQAVSEHPLDLREGVHNAYLVMANGINDTARNLAAAAATDTRGNKGVSGAVGEVLRQIPPAVVRPVIDLAAATNNVIDGVKYQLAPEYRQEDLDKWKKPHIGKHM